MLYEFTPDCVGQFHVVQWAMDTLDEDRRESWREAYDQVKAKIIQEMM